MRTSTRLAGLAAGVMLAAGALAVPSSAVTAARGVDLFGHLSGSSAYPAATGYSEYHQDMGMMRGREVEVNLHHLARLAGHQVLIYLNGTKVGAMRISSGGHGYHHWATWNGQRSPRCTVGSTVKIRTSGGVLIATGAYTPHHH
jgi:hypothetical protein